ncbi:hypothetical protein RF11_06584 [Thelohanellus kitauei]|uniref:Uncharacterized protein n=1 Tax=Thelohanellus kitauei TaxID=669202 RepID=A0A0C2IA89_THEKT|nr:hypothetical protein RF11_06584 [Thelohanellus kitauei]
MFNDILAIKIKQSKEDIDKSSDLVTKKTAIIFMKQVLLEYKSSSDICKDAMKLRRLTEVKTVCRDFMYDLMITSKDDLFIKEIIDLATDIGGDAPTSNILACKEILPKWNSLLEADTEKLNRINSCGTCIVTYIEETELSNGEESENHYRFYASLLEDLRPLVDERIQNNGEQWLQFHNEICKFFMQLDDYSNSSDSPQFKYFVEKYCRAFATQSVKAVFLLKSIEGELQEGLKDNFVVEIRANMLRSLITVFRFIPVQPLLNDVVSLIRSSESDYAKLKITADTYFPTDFREIIEMICNIPPDISPLLIDKFCECFKDFIYHYNNQENINDLAIVVLDTIYKWLGHVPGPAFNLCTNQKCYSEASVDDFLSDIDDDTNDPTSSDSARLALFTMTAFSKIIHGIIGMSTPPDSRPIFEKAIELCMTLIDRFEDNEEICGITCDVLTDVLFKSCSVYSDHEKSFEKLLRLYQNSGFACYVDAFVFWTRVYRRNVSGTKWFFNHSMTIFEQSCDFLLKEDINRHHHLLLLIMLLLQTILQNQYDDMLKKIYFEKLIDLACRGLLCQEQFPYQCCLFVLEYLFTRSYFPSIKPAQRAKVKTVRLFKTYFSQIVKNCIENILTHENDRYVYLSGSLLHTMNNAEMYGIKTGLKIGEELMTESLENYRDKIVNFESTRSELKSIINAHTKDVAGNLSKTLNSKLKHK